VLSGVELLARRLISELNGAARYVTSILPRDLGAPVPVTSCYVPSKEIGGDSFDYRWIDDDHLIAYLVDVSGHGIAPAMLTVSVHNLMRSGALDHETLREPTQVLVELNRLFQMDKQNGNYFTIWYGVYQLSTRTLRYAGAGHPPALVLTRDGSEPVRLSSESMPIGVLEDTTFEAQSYRLPPDCAVLIYSDGVFDLMLRDGRGWALGDFIDLCARTARSPRWAIDDLLDQLRSRSESENFEDDCTLVLLTVR
jgi:sigma-B regulation protein RsbU (phosphoserine phosphatase)